MKTLLAALIGNLTKVVYGSWAVFLKTLILLAMIALLFWLAWQYEAASTHSTSNAFKAILKESDVEQDNRISRDPALFDIAADPCKNDKEVLNVQAD